MDKLEDVIFMGFVTIFTQKCRQNISLVDFYTAIFNRGYQYLTPTASFTLKYYSRYSGKSSRLKFLTA